MLSKLNVRLCLRVYHGLPSATRQLAPGVHCRGFSSSGDSHESQRPDGARVNLQAAAGAQPISVEGYQGNLHEFSMGRAQAIVDRAEEEHGVSPQERQVRIQQGVQGPTGQDDGAYGQSGNVSLHSVMEDGVPNPNSGHPNHRNMPDHGGVLGSKVMVSGQIQDKHPSRGFCSSYPESGAQGGQDLRGADNLRKPVHDHHGSGMQGRKLTSYPESGTQGGQDLRGTEHAPKSYEDQSQGVQGSPVSVLARMDNPCPQGIQGHDCDRFKIWLNNCLKHGFIDCDEQLQGVQSGRKTLSEIFAEQDELIHRLGQKRSFSTSARSQVSGNADQPVEQKLSQRQRLQLAVKQYGSTLMVFHVTMSLSMLGCFYVAVSR